MIVLSAVLLAAPAAWAQTNPSKDELIKSLTPSAAAVNASGVRGLRRLEPESPAPAPHAAVGTRQAAIKAPVNMEEPAVRSAKIYVEFATGSADLTPQAMKALDELGKALTDKTLASYHFRIEGHTDTVGSKSYNQQLSERRAEAVVAYIEQKFGVEAARLTAVGMGSTHLIVQTGDQVPDPRNRCVQIINLDS